MSVMTGPVFNGGIPMSSGGMGIATVGAGAGCVASCSKRVCSGDSESVVSVLGGGVFSGNGEDGREPPKSDGAATGGA